MSIQISLTQPPFSFLTESQRQWLQRRLDLLFFEKGAVLLEFGAVSPGLFIVYKGVVEEQGRDGQVFTQYGSEDVFDVRALLESHVRHRFIALEETLCYRLKSDDFIELMAQSKDFARYFNSDLGGRHSLVEQRTGDVSEFILSRVDASVYRQPLMMAANASALEAAQRMQQDKDDAVLVSGMKTWCMRTWGTESSELLNHDRALENGSGAGSDISSATDIGIVTGTDLLRTIVLEGQARETCLGDIATTNLISIDTGEYLFAALLRMTEHQIERLVVTEHGKIVGLLELRDLLSTFSTHSHIVAMRIEQARSLDDLQVAAGRIPTLIRNLSRQGVNTQAMASLITTLNRRLMAKAFEMIIPAQYQPDVCMLVLGSEGRGEQLLKTDQDNALILRHESLRAPLAQPLQQLHKMFLAFGYPPCPGGVMLINADWCRDVGQWQHRIQHWMAATTPEAMMNLAMFIDAYPVAGNSALFTQLQPTWQAASQEASITASWFARPALQFASPLTLLGNIREDHGTLDIKKGAIFPLVHGVRSLAFEHGIQATNTLERIDALAQREVLSASMAQGLKDAFLLFLRLRLRHQLRQEDEAEAGLNQQLDVGALRGAERSLLRHALHRVKKFRQWLMQHYHLETL